jgi:hypothetical protein
VVRPRPAPGGTLQLWLSILVNRYYQIINDRLFFRSVRIAGEDDIMTCLMNNFKYIQNTTRIVSLKSSYKNNKHVEDPRVILHKDNYFICYTDGYNIGIAKLDLHCNTIYSHYLKKPDEVNFEGLIIVVSALDVVSNLFEKSSCCNKTSSFVGVICKLNNDLPFLGLVGF